MITRNKKLAIDRQYLMIPQTPKAALQFVSPDNPLRGYKVEYATAITVKVGNRTLLSQDMAISGSGPWWWAALDVAEWDGEQLEIEGVLAAQDQEAFDTIHLADSLREITDLYHEKDRPQFHFSYRHGALGDPTAMFYYPPMEEWHLFTIHNPFRGKECCWGHAVSKDLLHWQERAPIFHHPYLIYNGVGFADTENVLGLNRDSEQAIVLLTPLMGRQEGFVCMTISVDGGETFQDLNDLKRVTGRDDLPDNPIAPGWGDAPRIFWNPLAEKFFLTHCRWEKSEGENKVTSLQYTSQDLRKWSRIDNFPLLIDDNWHGEGDATDVLELPVDGNKSQKIVLIMCGRNGYALGRYSLAGLDNLDGDPLSSSDTIATQHFGYPVIFSGAPDGRGVIIYNVGNDRMGGIPNYEIGYKPNLSFPLELTIKSTDSGPRLFQNPIREIEQLYGNIHTIGDISIGASQTAINGPEGGLYRIQAFIEAGTAEEIDLVIMGYTITYGVINGTIGALRDEQSNSHHTVSQQNGGVQIDMLVDKTSIELYPNNGERFIYYGRLKLYDHVGSCVAFSAREGEGIIRDLKIIELDSIFA